MESTNNLQQDPITAPVEPVIEQMEQIKGVDKLKKFFKAHKKLAIGGLVGLVGIIAVGVWFVINKDDQEKLAFPPDQVVEQVGNETIYGADVNFVIEDRFRKSMNSTESNDELKPKARQQASDESVILQGGLKDGIIKESDLVGVFNSKDNDQQKRKELIDKVVQSVINSTPTADIEMITVWYYNFFPPQLPVDEAREYAFELISTLRRDVVSKKITLKQAGEKIAADKTMPKIDASYKGNAYFLFLAKRVDKNLAFDNEKIDQYIRSAQDGSISEVIDTGPRDVVEGSEAYFVVVKVSNKKNFGKENYPDWFEKHKKTLAQGN